MLNSDVVVAGGGVSGLLIASALAPHCSIVLLEQSASLPRNKYWLTDEKAASQNPDLADCIDKRYEFLDFVAYDGLRARVRGQYCLWDTEKLIDRLALGLSHHSVQVLTGHRLYSVSTNRNGVVVRANAETLRARLLIDCMGFGSPLVGAKNIASIVGYYIMHGTEVTITADLLPVALDNVIIDRHPTFFELFPTSKGTGHAGIILPARRYRPDQSLKGDLHFILKKSHYSKYVEWDPGQGKSYFGIIPVAHLYQPVLDRIVFFGEAGQANPAASATGLARMLRTYRALASSVVQCLKSDTLARNDLLGSIPRYMTSMNRMFQETLFESLLSFNSEDFLRLVRDLRRYPPDLINDLVFAEFDFGGVRSLRLAVDTLLRPGSVLGPHVLRSVGRFLFRKNSV